MENEMIEIEINKCKSTRDYFNYIQEHIMNVQNAWAILELKCKDEKFIYDDFEYNILDQEIKNHDLTKYSDEEFIPYRNKFYPYKKYDGEEQQFFDMEFNKAWEHHKKYNDHHWETWTIKKYPTSDIQSLHCVHMFIDWMAMSMKFKNTPVSYYEKNKDKITIPNWAEDMIYRLNSKIEKRNKNNYD